MPITHVHTYLVNPRSAPEIAGIGGTEVEMAGKLFGLLSDVYSKADHQCTIDISFNAAPDGTQQNPARDQIVAYAAGPSLELGRAIAQRLQDATDGRSGLGLLFLIKGVEEVDHKLVLSRFPADNGILAEMDKRGLNVEFLEKVFMKSAFSYKAVAYRGRSIDGGFWQGRAVDRQIGDPVARLSDYWIKGFLLSDFRVTPALGTRRLALALKNATRGATTVETRQAVTAAATLAPGLDGQHVSIREFQERYGLPPEARLLMNDSARTSAAQEEAFIFDAQEFERQIAFRSIELDTGAILTAPSSQFDTLFKQDPVPDGPRTRFSTTGAVVGERLRKAIN